MKANLDLSNLPYNWVKINRYFYKNSKTGQMVHKDHIHNYVPDDEDTLEVKREIILEKRWDLKMD
jgi:hypothetical protein